MSGLDAGSVANLLSGRSQSRLQQDARLFTIAAELRYQIYEHLLKVDDRRGHVDMSLRLPHQLKPSVLSILQTWSVISLATRAIRHAQLIQGFKEEASMALSVKLPFILL